VTPEGRTTEPENGYLKRRAPERALFEARHIARLSYPLIAMMPYKH
jgi:hypothetical protein